MFHTIFYEPIYNLLAFVLTVVPMHDVGIAVIVVTLIVKGVLLPLNLSAIRGQYLIRRLEPEMKKIRELQKKEPQEASKQMMDLYRREKINPLSSLFVIIIQIPILFALYFAFSNGLKLDTNSIYSFVSFPEILHTKAFGLFDITQKNILIALLAGVSAYFLAKRQTQDMVINKKENEEETFQDHFARSMKVQITYVLPVLTFVFSMALPAALPLYWFVGNIVAYGQDIYIKNKLSHLKNW